VRGLDYYTRTTFEILAGSIGAQNAILGGGRYDGLVKQLGGPDRVGIGFAAGIERLVLAMPESADARPRTAFFVASMGEPARDAAIGLLRDLRRAGLEAHMEYEGRSLKSQMKRADRLKAAYALILGEDELARGVVTGKDMSASEQTQVGRDAILGYCQARAAGGQE
jgi:histidyl-tRNA synthetase